MRHSNWYVSSKQQAHQRSINIVQPDLSKVDIHAVVNCRACFGRGYIGRNLMTGEIVPCKCLTLKAKVEHTEAALSAAKESDGHSSEIGKIN
jgi:hypothetical protein